MEGTHRADVRVRVREIIARTILRNAVDIRLRNLGIAEAPRGARRSTPSCLVNQGRALLVAIPPVLITRRVKLISIRR